MLVERVLVFTSLELFPNYPRVCLFSRSRISANNSGSLFVFTDMTDTTHFPSTDGLAFHQTGAPHIAGTSVAFTPHKYDQAQVASALTTVVDPGFTRFAESSGV